MIVKCSCCSERTTRVFCHCCFYCYCQLSMLSGARQIVHVSVRFSRSAGARLLSAGGADMRSLGTFRCSNTSAHRSRSATHVETTHHTSRLFASSGAGDDRQLLALLAWTGYGKRNDITSSYRGRFSARAADSQQQHAVF